MGRWKKTVTWTVMLALLVAPLQAYAAETDPATADTLQEEGLSVAAEEALTEGTEEPKTEEPKTEEPETEGTEQEQAQYKTSAIANVAVPAGNSQPTRVKVGEPVVLKSSVSGDTQGLQYKFLWMQDNWKKWAVIEDAGQIFSLSGEREFVFPTAGTYSILVDVKDTDGTVRTQTFQYEAMTEVWQFLQIQTSVPSPQEKYCAPIGVNVLTTGETQNLEYKILWMRDNWADWAVLKNFSGQNSAVWNPKDTGSYTLIVDIRDRDGRVTTYQSAPYRITPVKWNYDGMTFTPSEEQRKNQVVQIQADTSGNTTGFRYKFLWVKDNWKDWGVIRNFSAENQVQWLPTKVGMYTIYVDIMDRDGAVVTKTQDYLVVSQIWKHEGVTVNNGVPEQIYTNLPVKASVSGDTAGLMYKFVWMRDNWKEWGVIRDFSASSQALWYPKKAGTYVIYSNVRDRDGIVKTVTTQYTVQKTVWDLLSLTAENGTAHYAGSRVRVTANMAGDTSGLEYKFVWMRDNWADWGVLQDFGPSASTVVNLSKAGNYAVYVDIRDSRGVVYDPYILNLTSHSYTSAGASAARVSVNKSVQLYPNITGSSSEIQCKYVWARDGWKEWGVIRDFSTAKSVSWTPTAAGTYTICIDVKIGGVVQTRSMTLNVVIAKNGWYYEDGYKYYYQDDQRVYDVRSIIGSQSSYVLMINKQMSCVTAYAKDGTNGYIIPVVAFACSPGAATPIGTFYTQNKYRWQHLYGADGQFCTRITGHVLFHSPPYSSFNNHTLWPRDYNRLGTWASSGCVRLRTGDAKWIYDNCSLGTKVIIYNSSVAGPFPKPVYSKIPLSQTWDPTDPYA